MTQPRKPSGMRTSLSATRKPLRPALERQVREHFTTVPLLGTLLDSAAGHSTTTVI